MKRFSTSIAVLVLGAAFPLVAQDDSDLSELKILERASEILDTAKLRDVLEERQLLQDLDLKSLKDPRDVLKLAKEELKQLQEEGVIPIDAIRNAVEGQLDAKEEKGVSTDLLGPEPLKGTKVKADEEAQWITIENSENVASNFDEGLFVFVGDVLVNFPGTDPESPFTLRCDKLIVELQDETAGSKSRKGLHKAIATGRMVVINGKNDKGEPVEARCKQAVFRQDKVFLRQWPELTTPGTTIKAKDAEAFIEATIGKKNNFEPIGAFQFTTRKPEDTQEP